MESSFFDEALTVFGVGMVIVFVVLSLVVSSGNIIILLTNRIKSSSEQANKDTGIPPPILDVINTTVSKITDDKGKAVKIEKIR